LHAFTQIVHCYQISIFESPAVTFQPHTDKLNTMRNLVAFFLVLSVFCASSLNAQQKKKNKPENRITSQPAKKYPSLLWEISGNGMQRPSYLFGTMHVSDKLVFHLGDSFYNAIRSAEVVALETNPETWQDDYSKSVFFKNAGMGMDAYLRVEGYPLDNLSINSFAIESYTEILKAALAVEPSMINGMLYRTYGTQIDDFEEDTFLDMYLFQVGKKLGKRVTGVENFQESEKLVMEAYRDMIKDQNKKRRSYDFEGMMNNSKKIEDAYRNGDLDVLDSLESLTIYSDAFQEKFLYKRNLIQANAIDSILKKSSLFVGVGAAHLPGRRGVIEMLRDRGYRLRPVNMDERNSAQKDAIDKIHLPYNFKQQSSADEIYKVSIPGEKFYRFTNWSGMDIVQYADMVNGTYYMVNRIKTNSLFYGDNVEMVQKKMDSLLYENIPGKILKKTTITKNGYKGLDVMNRTRRGDYQRYNIFVTPFEVIIFKMSGNGEYVNIAEDAQQFFNSIRLQESPQVSWQNWQPPTGGFSIRVPHQPLVYHDKNYGTDRMEYVAADKEKGNTYLIMKANLHNYSYFEEDSFELNLLSESYSYSSFISRELHRKFINLNGYPAMDCQYLHKDGTFSKARYIIQGPIYYVLITKFKKEGIEANDFIESFKITPFRYQEGKQLKDTAMHFSVKTPSFKKEMDEEVDSKNKMQELIRLAYRGEDDDDWYQSLLQLKTRVFGNDTIGERIFVSFDPLSDYSFIKDSSTLWKHSDGEEWMGDTSFIVKLKKEYLLPNGFKRRDLQITDTGSSKLLLSTSFYKNGKFFTISSLTDTLSKRSSFLEEFVTSFCPDDSLKGSSPFTRKTAKFFSDFFGSDSLAAKSARRAVYQVSFDSVDVPLLIQGIDSLNWNIKDYLDFKKNWIAQLGYLKHSQVIPYLKSSYLKVGDTVELQHSVLNALLAQKTKESFLAFKNLMLQEPPIADENDDNWTLKSTFRAPRIIISENPRVHYGTWGELYDTLSLTKAIFPDFLQLMNIDDYRGNVMNLLTTLVDSGYLKAEDYETYFSKIYLDAKQLLKKQMAREEKEKIEKASRKDKPMAMHYPSWDYEEVDGPGNNSLHQYSILLLPFWDKNPGVPAYFKQLLNSENRKLLYETFILLVRNNKPVPDSLFQKFASLDEYRSDLYRDLQKMKKIEKFPIAFKKQELIARSLLINSGALYGKLDTLVLVDKLPLTYKNQKGFVYFFKYKRMKDDISWELGSVGMQPEDISLVDVENDDFTELEKRKLENDRPIREQLEKVLKELLYEKRTSASGFYEGRSMNMYRNFLPDMVKSNRYRD
jgi:uncharacterized protein YbaP (TraB family)